MPRSSGSRISTSSGEQAQEQLEVNELHLVQFWVPNVRNQEFLEEAERQSLAVAQSPEEADDQAFINAVSTWDGE